MIDFLKIRFMKLFLITYRCLPYCCDVAVDRGKGSLKRIFLRSLNQKELGNEENFRIMYSLNICYQLSLKSVELDLKHGNWGIRQVAQLSS